MKKIGLILVLASGCASSKYAVEAESSAITLNGAALVSVKPSGEWIWRKKPEEVVTALLTYLAQSEVACRAEIAKLKPVAKPATKKVSK